MRVRGILPWATLEGSPCVAQIRRVERALDTTWNCSHTCGAETTLNAQQKENRLNRIRAWQEQGKGEEAGKGYATGSSSAAGSAERTDGKGGKAGNRTRPFQHVDAGAADRKGVGKGTGKQPSGEEGKTGKRRRRGN